MPPLKKQIIDENKNKSGIYLLTNLLNKDQYVGQSIDLGKRFTKYFTLSYLKNRNTLVISRALIKYGYANFSISILEYCDKDILNEREQYYMDIIKPVYNTLKIAGSSSGYKHTQETKQKLKLIQSNRTKHPVKGISIQVKDTSTGKITFYDSLRNAGEGLNCSHHTIKNNLDNGKLFRNRYIITSIKNE